MITLLVLPAVNSSATKSASDGSKLCH